MDLEVTIMDTIVEWMTVGVYGVKKILLKALKSNWCTDSAARLT